MQDSTKVSFDTRLALGRLVSATTPKTAEYVPALRALMAHLATLEGDLRSLETAAALTAKLYGSTELMRAVMWHGMLMRSKQKALRLRLWIFSKLLDASKIKFPAGFEVSEFKPTVSDAKKEKFCLLVVVSAEILKPKRKEFLIRMAQLSVDLRPFTLAILAIHSAESLDTPDMLETEDGWKDPQKYFKTAPTAIPPPPKDERHYKFALAHLFLNPSHAAYNTTFLPYRLSKLFQEWEKLFPEIVVS